MYSVTQSIIEWLRVQGYEARSYPLKTSTPPFITVERTGGFVENMVDYPTIAVQAWGETEEEAEALAIAVRDAACTMAPPIGVHKLTVSAGPYAFWDEDTRFPRYQLVLDAACQLTE